MLLYVEKDEDEKICQVECFVSIYNTKKMVEYGFALVNDFIVFEERLYDMLWTTDNTSSSHIIPLSTIRKPLISVMSTDEERIVNISSNRFHEGPFTLFPSL